MVGETNYLKQRHRREKDALLVNQTTACLKTHLVTEPSVNTHLRRESDSRSQVGDNEEDRLMNPATTVVYCHPADTPRRIAGSDAPRKPLPLQSKSTMAASALCADTGSTDCAAIEGEVALRLQSRLNNAVDSISYRYDAGVLTLRGRLRSFYQKQLAQEAVRKLNGVTRVINCIDVSQDELR